MAYRYQKPPSNRTFTYYIKGNTFPVRDALRALGASWNAEEKRWEYVKVGKRLTRGEARKIRSLGKVWVSNPTSPKIGSIEPE